MLPPTLLTPLHRGPPQVLSLMFSTQLPTLGHRSFALAPSNAKAINALTIRRSLTLLFAIRFDNVGMSHRATYESVVKLEDRTPAREEENATSGCRLDNLAVV